VATVSWINKSSVTGSVAYSPSTATSGNVLATLTLSESGTVQTLGWTQINSITYTKTYTGNITSDIIVFENDYGTTGSQVVTINWIDKIAPTATITYTPNTNTNTNVTATLTASEAIATPSGWTVVNSTTYTKVYSVNTTETVMLTDLVGNTGSTNVAISWIDKTPVTGAIAYDITTNTNTDVV
jgi:hypothetical protein